MLAVLTNAAGEGLSRTSIIVAASSAGARRLYAWHGYREAGPAPMVKNGWEKKGRDGILLLKDLRPVHERRD